MWIKIDYNDGEISRWPDKPDIVKVSLTQEEAIPLDSDSRAFRLSPIFPLAESSLPIDISNSHIRFFSFKNPYRVLGRLKNKGSNEL